MSHRPSGRTPRRTCPSWPSSPACPAPGAARPPTCSRTSAGSSSTTCRPRCCRPWPSSAAAPRGDVARIAAVVDVRSRAFFADLTEALAQLARRRQRPADHLPRGLRRRRWSAGTRRSADRTRCRATGMLSDGIARERELLRDLRADADIVLDTTRPQRPRAARRRCIAGLRAGRRPGCTPRSCRSATSTACRSTPTSSLDCRFLPNPHWVPELRPLTGQDPAVRDYVLAQPGAATFLDAYDAAPRR